MIHAIHHVQITVPPGQVEAARAFYCGVLGLPEMPRPESVLEIPGFWMQVGGQEVHVRSEPDFDRLLTKAHIAYRVDDLEGWKQTLAAAGIETLPSIPLPGYDRFEFRDPFGNRVEFIRPARP